MAEVGNSLKLVSCNIEGDRHLPEVVAFVKRETPDIVCFQEVYQENVQNLSQKFGMYSYFFPMMKIEKPNAMNFSLHGLWGITIFSRLKPSKVDCFCYTGRKDNIPVFDDTNPNSPNRVLVWVELEKNSSVIRIATTHFTWSPKGQTTSLQLEKFTILNSKLSAIGDLVLCGDFNAPRGKEIWRLLPAKYQDHIPPEVTTTIDPKLHRAGDIQYVVDALFSTPEYEVTSVKVVSGVSDHMGIVGTVSLYSSAPGAEKR